MSGLLTKQSLLSLYNPNYEADKQKAAVKYTRSQHRASNEYNLENLTDTIYSNIIESAKKGEQSITVTIVEACETIDESCIYIHEIYGNSAIDIVDNNIVDGFSNPILSINNNNLYDISQGDSQIISNIIIPNEIDISGNNVVIDASNNVIFKISGTDLLGADDTPIHTINEAKLSTKVLECVLNKFDGITGIIDQSTPNKCVIFNWAP